MKKEKSFLSGFDYRESNFDSLWHGINMQAIESILKNKKLKPYTFHRYWGDGKIRKDKDMDYESSFWMKGWSTSRDRNYAMKFGSGILLELDKEYIGNHFKIIPISWNASISGKQIRDHKKEREEFVLAFKTGKTTQDFKDEYFSLISKSDDLADKFGFDSNEYKLALKEERFFIEKYGDHINYMKGYKVEEKNLDFNRAVKAIYAEKYILDLYKESKPNVVDLILSNPKFNGLYCSELANKNYELGNPKRILDKINFKKR